MKIHELKCWTNVFPAIVDGTKTAEYRKNDRDYQVGDILKLKEYDPSGGQFTGQGEYTGEMVLVKVTHIVYGGQFGIPDGYCVMSIKQVE